jgi:hypothetical protein
VNEPDSDKPPTAPKEFVRDPLANPGAIIADRERSMAERLELAISWNKVASELRAGMIRLSEQAAERR